MFFHTSESDRSIPEEFSQRSHSEGNAESITSRRTSRSKMSLDVPHIRELLQPLGDEDECPVSDENDPHPSDNRDPRGRLPDRIRKPIRTALPAEMLRTSVSPRAKQQFVRFEHDLLAELQGEYAARTSPVKSRNSNKNNSSIDMRLKGNMIHIGGCWGSVDLSEAVDFKPRKRQEIGLVNPIVAPGKSANVTQRTVFRPSNSQLPEPPLPKYLV